MQKYAWPGNVRELQNRIKRALVLAEGPFVGPNDLELQVPATQVAAAGSTLREAREELEREIIARKLKENSGNISKTAKVLGISRPTLYELMTRYELDWRSS